RTEPEQLVRAHVLALGRCEGSLCRSRVRPGEPGGGNGLRATELAWGKVVLWLDLQAIAFDVDDSDALPDACRNASRRPFAIADAHSPAVRIDGADDDHHLAQEACGAVVQQRIGAVVVA